MTCTVVVGGQALADVDSRFVRDALRSSVDMRALDDCRECQTVKRRGSLA